MIDQFCWFLFVLTNSQENLDVDFPLQDLSCCALPPRVHELPEEMASARCPESLRGWQDKIHYQQLSTQEQTKIRALQERLFMDKTDFEIGEGAI